MLRITTLTLALVALGAFCWTQSVHAGAEQSKARSQV